MYEVFSYNISDKSVDIPLPRFPFSQHVYPDNIMQYTGLNDKNGKEIYEGDIVTWKDSLSNEIYGAATIYPEEAVEFNGGAFYPVCTMPENEFEIIDNIHENPELLNTKNPT
ncbi:MAG: hypothetical protein KAV87_39935 [Desulfobacteraceae bacterium]|nr:hypothetical protein [Desulfobacteraceae bacterium]